MPAAPPHRARVARLALVGAGLVVTAGLLAAGCGSRERDARPGGDGDWPDPAGPPDLLLVTIDTFRADRAGCLGHPGGLTPAIDRALRRGVLAREAYAPVPLTAPSHATILTGVEPPTHGVRDNGAFPLPADLPNLAGFLRERGWRTGAAVAAVPVSSRFGFDAGFDTFDDALRIGDPLYLAERPAGDVVDAALAWVDTLAPSDRWFLWAHFFDPHQPWRVLPDLRRFPADSDYEREIRAVDVAIRRLIRGLEAHGGGRDPVIAIVSDHGEGLGEHRESSHGILVQGATMHGLLGVAAPAGTAESGRLGAGLRTAATGYADLFPTLCDVLGLEPPDGLEGASWLDPSATTEGVYGETYYPMIHYGWSPLLSWRDARWTYVEGPNPELFDRTVDPGETRNVLASHAGIAARMSRLVASVARDPEPPDLGRLDARTREQMLALGYLSSGGGSIDRTRDPKQLVEVTTLLFTAIHRLRDGEPAAAQELLQRAYRLDPQNASVLYQLGQALRRLGDPASAAAYYRRAVDRNPGMAEAWSQLALAAFDRGQRDRAFELLDEGLQHAPDAPPLLLARGDLRLETGDLRAAAEDYRRVAHAQPDSPDPLAALAHLAELEGDRPEADRLWARVHDLAPSHPRLPPRWRAREGE